MRERVENVIDCAIIQCMKILQNFPHFQHGMLAKSALTEAEMRTNELTKLHQLTARSALMSRIFHSCEKKCCFVTAQSAQCQNSIFRFFQDST